MLNLRISNYSALLTCVSNPVKSHCAVEWDEDGKPVSVVMARDVASAENEGHGRLIVGDLCKVSVTKGTKTVIYNATLLGIGSKKDMESLLNDIEQENDNMDCVEEEGPSLEIQLQTPRLGELEEMGTGVTKRKGPTLDRGVRVEARAEVESRTKSNRKRPATGKKVSATKRAQLENSRASKELLDVLSNQAFSDEDEESDAETHASRKRSTTAMEDVPHTVTEESLLFGLDGSVSTSPQHSRRTPPHTTPTSPFSPTESPCLSPFSPKAHSSLLRKTGHSRRHPLRDVANRNQCDLERSFMAQLSILRGWLESQFRDINTQFQDLNGKIINVEDSILRLKENIIKKRSKKVQFDVAGNFGKAHVELGDVSLGQDTSIVEERRDTRVTTERGPLEVCCGDPRKPSCVWVEVPSQAALSLFREMSAFPPKDPGRYALKLLSVLYSDEELAESNCTRAEGRKLIDQNVLIAIKEQTNYKFPLEGPEADLRWHNIVSKVLNNKCRSCQKKQRARKEQENQEN